MALGERMAVSVAPFFLRVGLGITFLWAGMGKFMAKENVQGDDAALLANVGVIKPQQTPAGTAPAGTTSPSEPAASPPPAPSQPIPPSEEPPKEAGKDAPKAGKPAGKTKASAPESATSIVTVGYQPSGVVKYTAREFPGTSEVPRVHLITLMLIKSATPPPDADGKARMALVPSFASRGNWPVIFAYSAAVAESLGGAFLLVGLFTRLSALAVAWTIGVAGWLTVIGPAIQNGNTIYGFLPNFPRYDGAAWMTPLWQLTLLMSSLALMFAGPGGLSLDRLIFGRSKDVPKPPPAKAT